MTREFITAAGGFVNETGARQEILSGGTLIDESTSTGGLAPANLVLAPQTTAPVMSTMTISVTAPAVAFAFATPVDGRIVQRQSGVGDIAVTGTYSVGTPVTIEARLVLHASNTVVAGFDWAVLDAAPAGGVFAFTLNDVPEGGGYNVQIRDSATPDLSTVSDWVGVGALVALIGQSNAYRWFRVGDSSLTPDAKLRIHGNIDTWGVAATASMNGAIAAGNALIAELGIPVGLIDGAWDGSGLIMTNSGGRWTGGSSNAYVAFKAIVDAIGSRLEACVWIQGETEAKLLPGQAAYYNGLTSLFSAIRTDFSNASMPIVLAFLGKRTDGTVTDADTDTIKMAQLQKSADANIYRVERTDLPLTDGVHHTAPGYTTLGTRCANAVLFALGLVSQYRGPRIVSAAEVSASIFDVTIAHASGTDFTPTSGITGFRVLDGVSEIAVSSAARTNATTIRLTLASDPSAAPTIGYMYGATPTITAVVKDNSTLTLPMEYSAQISAIDPTPPESAGEGGFLNFIRRRGRR